MGAEKKTEKEPEIKELLRALLESHKAGSPTDSNVYWISLKPYAIAKIFEEQHHIKISNGLVKRLLKELGYGYRKQTGLSVIVCHYPPYCSKWNPIEHRLFSQVHKAMEGVVFSDYQTVQKLIEQTSTKTGLSAVVRLNLKEYQIGVKVKKTDIDQKRIVYHPAIPELNYRIYP